VSIYPHLFLGVWGTIPTAGGMREKGRTRPSVYLLLINVVIAVLCVPVYFAFSLSSFAFFDDFEFGAFLRSDPIDSKQRLFVSKCGIEDMVLKTTYNKHFISDSQQHCHAAHTVTHPQNGQTKDIFGFHPLPVIQSGPSKS